MTLNFWNLEPGDTGFKVVRSNGEIEDDWFVAELLYTRNMVRIYKQFMHGVLIKMPTKPEWDEWQKR